MTSVRLYRDKRDLLSGFSVIGHTGFAGAGEDIVCAGVSALALAAINALETVAHIPAHPYIGDGYVSIRLPKGLSRRQRDDAQIILRTAQQGFTDIAAAYPRFVRCS